MRPCATSWSAAEMTKERRQYLRTPHTCDARYRVAGSFSEAWGTVTVLNLGAGGVRFRTADGGLEPAVLLDLMLSVPGVEGTLTVQGRAAWTAMPAAGVIEAGVEFLDLSSEQAAVLDRLVSFLRGG